MRPSVRDTTAFAHFEWMLALRYLRARRREGFISVLAGTMGATRGAIMRVLLINAASIGVVGTLTGALLGVIFCWRIDEIRRFVAYLINTSVFDPNVYYLTQLPADVSLHTTGAIVAMALSVLATLYPSWRAARLDPADALRYD
jgi:lipoprotein-releasing system permease protein